MCRNKLVSKSETNIRCRWKWANDLKEGTSLLKWSFAGSFHRPGPERQCSQVTNNEREDSGETSDSSKNRRNSRSKRCCAQTLVGLGNLLRTCNPTLQARQVSSCSNTRGIRISTASRRWWEVRSLERAQRSGEDSLDDDYLPEGQDSPRGRESQEWMRTSELNRLPPEQPLPWLLSKKGKRGS